MARVSISQTEVICAKCGTTKELIRHHKGNDLFVGFYNKRIRKEYYQYKDCVKLCNECHMKIHWLYMELQDRWHIRTARGAVAFRKKCIKKCDNWLLGMYESKPPAEFIAKWNRRYESYRKAKRSGS